MSITTAADVHEWTGPTGVKFRGVREPSGTYYRDTTPRAVIDALEDARICRKRVRLFLGDKDTGRDWGEEYDVAGRVGRSMGSIKIPILVLQSNSSGGGAISCDCIVRLMVEGREVYRHVSYHQPEYEVAPGDMPGYGAQVLADGSNIARFKTEKKAVRWIAFMRGERMGK